MRALKMIFFFMKSRNVLIYYCTKLMAQMISKYDVLKLLLQTQHSKYFYFHGLLQCNGQYCRQFEQNPQTGTLKLFYALMN